MNPMLKSYIRALIATTLTAMLALHKNPVTFTGTDWLIVANTVWVSFIPVVIRAIDPNDTAFGVNSTK